MAVGDDILNTPVLNLNSPFSEVLPALDRMPVPEEKSFTKNVKRKRKIRTSLRARNASRKRRFSSPDTDSDIEDKDPIAIQHSDVDDKELLSLQVQKAMIADEDGDRPIHIAVAQEDLLLVKKLCVLMKTAGVSLDLMNHLRQTPLHVALIVGNNAAAEVLLRSGASIACEDRHGNNAIQLSVKYFHEEAFAALLRHKPPTAALNSLDFEGFTALHYAVKHRNAIAIKGLYKAGADIDATDGKSGRTSLAHAILAKDEEMIRLLLQCHASIDKVDYSGQNALDIALITGNKKVISILENDSPYKPLVNFELPKKETKPSAKKRKETA